MIAAPCDRVVLMLIRMAVARRTKSGLQAHPPNYLKQNDLSLLITNCADSATINVTDAS